MKKMKFSHIKIGDKVKIISGNQKGIIGRINTILMKKSIVYIDGISPRLKVSKNSRDGKTEQINLEIPIHFSNVMLWDSQENIASRIGYKMVENKKRRYFKKSGNLI
jgi:large subunit ribosomal protein L24